MLIANGRPDQFELESVFFAFPAANPGGFENVRFRNGAIEFEDLAAGGDQDFNDMVVRFEVAG